MSKMFRFLTVGVAVLMLTGCSGTSKDTPKEADKGWPTGTVTIFVPSKAGSNMDIKARIVSKYLGEEFGQSVVVENRPGAGGVTACTQFLTEVPNSNSIEYMAASNLAVSPLYNDVEFTADDFAIAAGLDTVENGIFVDASLGITTLEELKEYGKDKVVKFSSAGLGNDSFLMCKALMEFMGLQSDNISGDSFPDCMINVISGNADICYSALNIASQYVEEGTLIPLAVYSKKDFTGYKDFGFDSVPTLKSQGYDISYSTITWFALRGGSDEKNVGILAEALNNIYKNEEFLKEMKDAGFVMMEDTSTEKVTEIAGDIIEQCKNLSETISK